MLAKINRALVTSTFYITKAEPLTDPNEITQVMQGF
jgi:hypothetical protein